jgi:hypothetical protein
MIVQLSYTDVPFILVHQLINQMTECISGIEFMGDCGFLYSW